MERLLYLVELTDSMRRVLDDSFGVKNARLEFAANHVACNYVKPGWNVVGTIDISVGHTTDGDDMPDFRGVLDAGASHFVDSEYITRWLTRNRKEAIPVEIIAPKTPWRLWIKSRFDGIKLADSRNAEIAEHKTKIEAVCRKHGIDPESSVIVETHYAGRSTMYAYVEEYDNRELKQTWVIEFDNDEDGEYEFVNTLEKHNEITGKINAEFRDQ